MVWAVAVRHEQTNLSVLTRVEDLSQNAGSADTSASPDVFVQYLIILVRSIDTSGTFSRPCMRAEVFCKDCKTCCSIESSILRLARIRAHFVLGEDRINKDQ